MTRPDKKDFDFNNHMQTLEFAVKMIRYADELESKEPEGGIFGVYKGVSLKDKVVIIKDTSEHGIEEGTVCSIEGIDMTVEHAFIVWYGTKGEYKHVRREDFEFFNV